MLNQERRVIDNNYVFEQVLPRFTLYALDCGNFDRDARLAYKAKYGQIITGSIIHHNFNLVQIPFPLA